MGAAINAHVRAEPLPTCLQISKHFLGWSLAAGCSLAVGETGLLLVALAAVGLDVGADAAGSSEVLLGLSGGGGSQKKSVGAYTLQIIIKF